MQVIRLTKFDYRLANRLQTDLQKLRCRVNYHALRFTAPIQEMGEKLIQRMRERSKYFIALHLRCTHNLSWFKPHISFLFYTDWKENGSNAKNIVSYFLHVSRSCNPFRGLKLLEHRESFITWARMTECWFPCSANLALIPICYGLVGTWEIAEESVGVYGLREWAKRITHTNRRRIVLAGRQRKILRYHVE